MNGRKVSFSFASTARVFAFLAATGFAQAAPAETVEVAPGIQVTKRTYSAPANEQPFFGFAVKTDAQRAEDANSSRRCWKRPARRKRRWMKLPSAAGAHWRRASTAKRRCGSIRLFSSRPSRAWSITASPWWRSSASMTSPLPKSCSASRQAAQPAENAECGLRPGASGREAAKGGTAGAGAGRQGCTRFRRRLDQPRLGPPGKRRQRRRLRCRR